MEPIHIRRSQAQLLTVMSGIVFIFTLWLLAERGIVEIDGASSLPARFFMLGFVFPASLWFFAMWAVRKRSILSIYEHHLELHSGSLLNHVLSLSHDRIEAVSTNWEGANSDSSTDLIFTLDAKGAKLAGSSRVLKYENDLWRFHFSVSERLPSEVVELITIRIKRPGADNSVRAGRDLTPLE